MGDRFRLEYAACTTLAKMRIAALWLYLMTTTGAIGYNAVAPGYDGLGENEA